MSKPRKPRGKPLPRPQHPNSRANLRPWKKGECPNPAGRPKTHHELVDELRMGTPELLAEYWKIIRKKRRTHSDEIGLKAIALGFNRAYGKSANIVLGGQLPGGGAADGTLLDLDSAMSPLLQAAQQAVIEEQQKQLPPPAAKMVEPVEVEAVGEKPAAAEIFSPHEPEKPLEVEPVKAVIEPVTPVSPVQEPDLPRGDYMAFRARERREQAERDQERARLQEEARRQGRPGGQLTREEAYPADPREPPEVVRFGRIPGSRGIRRIS